MSCFKQMRKRLRSLGKDLKSKRGKLYVGDQGFTNLDAVDKWYQENKPPIAKECGTPVLDGQRPLQRVLHSTRR